ncbi:MAG: type II secretion system GspH family protein [Planctomycetaceae bacterium]|nr:type II secretion system GspH family protein [Planctomycetaceae bacterium]
MKKGFTLTELLVAVGLLVAVLAASTMIFHYAIEAQRTAMATAEIMRTLRAVTDQLNINLAGLRKDGYLILYSNTIPSDGNHCDALYFFSDGDFQSTADDKVRSNIARIYFGGAKNDVNNLLLDMKLLVPSKLMDANDWSSKSFVECQQNISTFEDPNDKLNYSGSRPEFDANHPDNLLAQGVSNLKITWTYDSSKWHTASGVRKIEWYGLLPNYGDSSFESAGYRAVWTPSNPDKWPAALRFEFTISDSRKIIKDGKRFEHIVYIGQ